MRRNRFFLLPLLSLILFLAAGCDSGPKLPKLSADAVVLAFGDSLTRGTGADGGQPYPELLAGLLDRTVINSGVPGEVSAEGRQRLPGVLDEHAPQLVILCHGGNDFLRRHDIGQTEENLRAMIREVRGRGASVVLVGVPRLEFGLSVPPFYRTLAEEFKIPYEDSILLKLLGDNNFKSDMIHPNAAGYQRLAEALHERIVKAQN